MSTIDPEDIKYYEKYLTLFNQDGWVQFIAELRQTHETNEQTADTRCITNDLWQYERGMKELSRRILSFESNIRSAYDMISNPQQDLDPDDEEI